MIPEGGGGGRTLGAEGPAHHLLQILKEVLRRVNAARGMAAGGARAGPSRRWCQCWIKQMLLHVG